MQVETELEQALEQALARGETSEAPPKLAAAVRHAVFPGGGRIRPRLCMAVAQACGGQHPGVTLAAACAIELMHCASLVHDDLPCFDGAMLRRGLPSVHAAHGEPLAVLAGDALIVRAFECLVLVGAEAPESLPAMVSVLGSSTGLPGGICAGQAWECEPTVNLSQYQQAKTGALFWAATSLGALSAGREAQTWGNLGARLGEAYQVADDIKDMAGDEAELGKPVGQDTANARPSAALKLGLRGAIDRLDFLVQEAMKAIPPCSGAGNLRHLIKLERQRLVPRKIASLAA